MVSVLLQLTQYILEIVPRQITLIEQIVHVLMQLHVGLGVVQNINERMSHRLDRSSGIASKFGVRRLYFL